MECPVCFAPLTAATTVHVQPCLHAYCAACLERIMCASGGTCALCRGTIAGVEEDTAGAGRVIAVGRGKHAGVTLTNAADGVRVVALKPRDAAAQHLRVGDVITHINGIPAVHHCVAVAQIDEATRHGIPVRVHVHKRSAFLRFFSRRRRTVLARRETTQRFLDAQRAWVEGHTHT